MNTEEAQEVSFVLLDVKLFLNDFCMVYAAIDLYGKQDSIDRQRIEESINLDMHSDIRTD